MEYTIVFTRSRNIGKMHDREQLYKLKKIIDSCKDFDQLKICEKYLQQPAFSFEVKIRAALFIIIKRQNLRIAQLDALVLQSKRPT